MAEKYTVVAYDVGSKIELTKYNLEVNKIEQKFKWTEPLVKVLGPDKFAFVFSFGSIVFVNVQEDEVKKVLADLKKYIREELRKKRTEVYSIEVDKEKKLEISYDSMTTPQLSSDYLKILTFVMAQSVTLESFEEKVEDTLNSLEKILTEFHGRGKLKSNKLLVKTIAFAMKTRHSIITDLVLLDKPDIAWESKRLDEFYQQLAKNFELKDRFDNIEHKLQVILDNCQVIVDMMATKKQILLELIIVILFILDVLLILVEIFKIYV